jgi:pimeloyl-ACP methyl ester carboxylesterase
LHVPAVLGQEYFSVIEAPCKRLVWFEQSAHNPPFEKPEKFNRLMIEQVAPFAEEDRRGPNDLVCH